MPCSRPTERSSSRSATPWPCELALLPRVCGAALDAMARSNREGPCTTFGDKLMPNEADEEERNMSRTHNHDERIARMTLASVYPHYLAKVERKGRTKEELHQVIRWLTGFDERALQKHIKDKATFEQLFQHAELNPNAHLIKGVICGYRVEEIENPLTQRVRYMDKLVDELAKGRKMERILRAE
jgi:hypothetical protein